MKSINDKAEVAQVQYFLDLYRDKQGALLPLLHAIQERLGYIPPVHVPAIAQALNLSRAEVHGVISYYHFFRSDPPAAATVQICLAEACRACGAQELLAHAEKKLGCTLHKTRADGATSLLPVYCLGLCAQSPAVQIDDQLHAHVTPEKLDALLKKLELTQ